MATAVHNNQSPAKVNAEAKAKKSTYRRVQLLILYKDAAVDEVTVVRSKLADLRPKQWGVPLPRDLADEVGAQTAAWEQRFAQVDKLRELAALQAQVAKLQAELGRTADEQAAVAS